MGCLTRKKGDAAMSREISRREFVKESVLASAGAILAAEAASEGVAAELSGTAGPPVASPGTWTGKIGNLELSRLMLGGSMITGYAHSRDLDYVPALMRHYHTPAKIAETLEIVEKHGINSINTTVWDDVTWLRAYWRSTAGRSSGSWRPTQRRCPIILLSRSTRRPAKRDVIYMQGVCANALVKQKNMGLMKRAVEHMRGTGRPIGIGAHSLSVIVQCEKAKLDVDFYQKTLHTRDYPTAPRPEETGEMGTYDNSWCRNADEVIDFMKTVRKPWIAFKVMAAGAIPPRKAFPHAFNGGADFVLAGMFDFQVADNVRIAKESLANAKRRTALEGLLKPKGLNVDQNYLVTLDNTGKVDAISGAS